MAGASPPADGAAEAPEGGAAQPRFGAARSAAFRLPLLLLLIGALAAGWGDLLPRLERAAVPSASNRGPAEIQAMEFWITPPEYTGIAPIFVRAGDAKPEPGKADASAPDAKRAAAAKNTGVAPAAQKDAKLDEPQKISVPKGSKLLIQLHGRLGAPRLKLGEAETPFAVVDETTHRLETVLEQGGRLSIEGQPAQFRRRASMSSRTSRRPWPSASRRSARRAARCAWNTTPRTTMASPA